MRGDYTNHPGFEAGDCPLRIVVRPHAFGLSSRGFACSSSGGHCVPNDNCKAIVKEHQEEYEFAEVLLWRPELA